MQQAMEFLQSEMLSRDIEEQLIVNNRNAGSIASANLYRKIDDEFLKELLLILTDGFAWLSQRKDICFSSLVYATKNP